MKEVKWRIPRDDLKGATHLEIMVSYDLGGRSYFTGQSSRRGYYLSVRPVTIRDNTVSFDLFAGRRKFLLETARFSKKQLNYAVVLAKGFEDELINAVVTENKAA